MKRKEKKRKEKKRNGTEYTFNALDMFDINGNRGKELAPGSSRVRIAVNRQEARNGNRGLLLHLIFRALLDVVDICMGK